MKRCFILALLKAQQVKPHRNLKIILQKQMKVHIIGENCPNERPPPNYSSCYIQVITPEIPEKSNEVDQFYGMQDDILGIQLTL